MKKILLMAILAIGLAVQGYAQRPHHHHHHHPMPSWYIWNAVAGYYYYSALNCYWWGPSWSEPNKVRVDCIEFKRTSRGRLRIKNGNLEKEYYSMWEENSWRFRCPNGVIADVSTGNGQTKIKVRSQDGKLTSSYTLTARRIPYTYYGYYY